MIAWGNANVGKALSAATHKEFEDALSGHAWAKAFPGAVVVALIYEDERQELITKLAEVAKGVNEKSEGRIRAYLLISPPIPKGSSHYSGWAAKEVWPELNKRSAS